MEIYMTEVSKELRDKFSDLAGQLSPENLCCDGEAPMSYVRQRQREIAQQWAALEKVAGRKVSLHEAENWMVEEITNRFKNK
jgi:hypothetical protein